MRRIDPSREEPRARPASDPVVRVVAAERRGDKHGDHDADLHAARRGERADDEEQRIARKKWRDDEPRFAKNNGEEQRIYPAAVRGDERGEMLVEMDGEVPRRRDEFHAADSIYSSRERDSGPAAASRE